MRIATASLAIIVLAVTSGCASTGDVEEQKAVQTADVAQDTRIVRSSSGASDPDAVTCKQVQHTGTRFKTEVCATNRQWKASEEYSQQATEKMQSRPQYREDGG